MKLGILGAYTCCDNIQPHLSIAPPPTEEPATGEASEDKENNANDHGNVSPGPAPVVAFWHTRPS